MNVVVVYMHDIFEKTVKLYIKVGISCKQFEIREYGRTQFINSIISFTKYSLTNFDYLIR